MTVRVRAERVWQLRGTCTTLHGTERSAMGIANSRGVLPGTRGCAGAQRVQRVVWTPVHALGAAARVTRLSASTWPTQHPAAAPRTPSSSRRGRTPPTRATHEHTVCGPRAAPERERGRPGGRSGRLGRVRPRARRRRGAARSRQKTIQNYHFSPPTPPHTPKKSSKIPPLSPQISFPPFSPRRQDWASAEARPPLQRVRASLQRRPRSKPATQRAFRTLQCRVVSTGRRAIACTALASTRGSRALSCSAPDTRACLLWIAARS